MSKPSLKIVDGELVARGEGVPARAPLPRTARIKTLSDVRRDMLRVYRAGRSGLIDSTEVGRWMYAAGQIGVMIERADVEPRLEALEQRLIALTDMLARQAR